MAAFRIRIFRRVRLVFSGLVVVMAVAVLVVDFVLSWEYWERLEAALDQRFLVDLLLLSVPRMRMLGIEGEVSSGDAGVSSNSVVGVSGREGRGSEPEPGPEPEPDPDPDFSVGRLLFRVLVLLLLLMGW